MSTTTNAAPLYVQFAAQIRAEIEAQGLPEPTAAETPTGFPENEGYFFVEFGPHGSSPALIVPKSKTRMGALHSHVDLSGIPGHIALPRRNGRVVCHFEPDAAKVSKALASFVGASKRPVAPPVRRLSADSRPASQPASQPASKAPPTPAVALTDMFPGLSSAPASHVGSYSEEEAEEALQALNRG